MRITGIFLLILIFGLTCGITGCGTSCSDACNKFLECDYKVSVVWGVCEYFCENTSDCAAQCDPDLPCDLWIECVSLQCQWWF